MPHYSVLLRGEGILLPMDGGKEAVGFFITRAVKAKSPDEAIVKVTRIVEAMWRIGELKQRNKGAAPKLSTEEVKEIGWWHALKIRNVGFVFHEKD